MCCSFIFNYTPVYNQAVRIVHEIKTCNCNFFVSDASNKNPTAIQVWYSLVICSIGPIVPHNQFCKLQKSFGPRLVYYTHSCRMQSKNIGQMLDTTGLFGVSSRPLILWCKDFPD